MTITWAEGFHAPKGVAPEAVKAALDELPEPSPEALFEATKDADHVLHCEIWAEGDQVWANRGRLERCRKIISAVKEVLVIGGKSVEIRAVEFVRVNGDGHWRDLDAIRQDQELLDAYLNEIERLQDQAAAKLRKYRELISSKD